MGVRFAPWPHEIADAVRDHVERAIQIDPKRYHQEPNYVAALFGRLEGVVYDKPDGRVAFINTVVNDRGPGSAESKWGADFALTAELNRPLVSMSKGVLGQAKKGQVEQLDPSTYEDLELKCSRIFQATKSVLALEVPKGAGAVPRIRIVRERTAPETIHHGKRVRTDSKFAFEDELTLDAYLIDQLMDCMHGDARPPFVEAVRESSLATLHLVATSSR